MKILDPPLVVVLLGVRGEVTVHVWDRAGLNVVGQGWIQDFLRGGGGGQ